MRVMFLGFFCLCCIAIVNCELRYEGPIGNQHIFTYNGDRYITTESFYKSYQTNPLRAEQKFINDRRADNRFSNDDLTRPQRPSALDNNRDESVESQKVNNLKPNKIAKPHGSLINSTASNFHFPQWESPNRLAQNNTDTDFIPTTDTGFSREIPKDREREEYKDTRVISDFAWNLFKNSNKNSNFVIGTLSPQILLSYLAWVSDGPTRNELVAANGYGSPNQIQTVVASMLSESAFRELQIATAFFVSEDMRINQEFLEKSIEYADLIRVDFRNPEAASRTVNKWAKSKTKGGLRLKEINYAPSTKMALTSAMYFKGKFVYTFEDAKPGVFFTENGPVDVSMMNMKRKFHWGNLGNLAEWVAIPYESSDSLIIILPKKDQHIENVINSLNSNDIDVIMRGMDSDITKANVNITLPKFRMESTSSLIGPLRKMGINTLFTPQADLSYLSDYDTVQVNNAQQQASLEVNEQGTVFVAFTNLNVVALSFQVPVPDVEFNVNRPFIAIIANTKKNIPFVMAKVLNPTA